MSSLKIPTCEKGFSLVEALVTGVISVILTGVVLAIYRTNNAQLTSASANIKLKQQHEIVLQYVTEMVNEAQAIIPLESLDSWGNNVLVYPDERSGYLYRFLAVRPNPDGRPFVKGIGIHANNYLVEFRAAGDWPAFLIGRDTVFTTPFGGGSSHFQLLERYRGVSMKLDLATTLLDGSPVLLPMPNTLLLSKNILLPTQIFP
jgi:hypothetical protein